MDFGAIAAVAVSALKEQLPTVSPLDGVGVTEGRMDVLAGRALQRMANKCGDPAVAVLHEQARPIVDTVLTQTIGPRRVRR